MKFWKSVLLISIPYIVILFLFKIIDGNEVTTSLILATILSGVFFGIFSTWFTEWFAKRQIKKIVVDLHEGETLIKEAGANHFVKYEGVGGKLVLTNNRLIFKSHKLNIQTHQLDIPVHQIESLSTDKSLGF
jgi:hypothetical protein